jgi:putative heme-binding domain-containing protein
VALGRIGDAKAVPALLPALADPDVTLAFSARQALRRIDDWKQAAAGLASGDAKVRAGLLAAMELVYEPEAAGELAKVAGDEARPEGERARALEYLAQVHRKAAPWDGKWWGTRPTRGQPPAKTIEWEGTPLVLKAVREGLTDAKAPIRLAAIKAAKEARDPEALPILRRRFGEEPDAGARAEIALALGVVGDKDALPLLVGALRSNEAPDAVREAALTSVEALGTDVAVKALADLLGQADLAVERQPRVIAALGKVKAEGSIPGIAEKLASPAATVRSAAAEALGKIGKSEGVSPRLLPLLDDPDMGVRKAAIGALSALKTREAVPALVEAAGRDETRFEATMALAALPDTKALQVFLNGLGSKSPELRRASATALGSIREQAGPVLDELAKRRELSPSLLPELRKVFASNQPVMRWRVLGPFPREAEPPFSLEGAIDLEASYTNDKGAPADWKRVRPADRNGQVDLAKSLADAGDVVAYGFAEVQSPAVRKAEMVVGSDDSLTVWLNGKKVYDHKADRGYSPDQDRFEVSLEEGANRVLIACGNTGGPWQFSVAIGAHADYAFLKGAPAGGFDPDAYRNVALKGKGKPDHGKELFSDLKGLACIKCHTVGGQGGTVGPELSSIGVKYPREELITAVLVPSAKISQGYESVVVAVADGRVLTGIIKGETPEALEIEDADAKKVRIPKDDIEDRKNSDVSIMPNGLAEGLTPQDFADLIAYLETLKQAPSEPAKPGGGR